MPQEPEYDDPRLFKKYGQYELTHFETFYAGRKEDYQSEGHARAVWIWGRKDVSKRAKKYGVENPLAPLPAHPSTTPAVAAPVFNRAVADAIYQHSAGPTIVPSERSKPIPPLEERERVWDSLEASSKARGVFSPTTDSTTLSVSQDAPVMILFVGDIHSGGHIRYDLLRRDMELLRDTEGMYGIGMGDYVDNYKPQAKSGNGLYHQAFADPRLQLAHVTDRMALAKGKWVAICQGNHDAWDYKYAGIDRLPDLARHLDAAYFSEAGGTVFVQCGSQRYVLVVKHQYGGGSRINTSNNQRRVFDEFPQWENADVVCLAHLHYNDMHQTPRKGKTVTYLRTGTYKTEDEWAASHGYTPEYGVPSVILYPKEHIVVPFRGDRITEAVQYFKYARAIHGTS